MIETVGVARLLRWSQLSMRAVAVVLVTIAGAKAQPSSGGQVLVPGSSLEQPGDIGVRPHTNTLIFVPNANGTGGSPAHPSAPLAAPQHHRKKSAGATTYH